MLNKCFKYACAHEETAFLGENRCLSGCFSGILTFRGRPTRGLILILAALGYNLLVRQ